MKTEIDKTQHEIVYIDYLNGLPDNVYTMFFVDTAKKPYWRLTHYIIFPNNGDINDLRAYEYGSGGNPQKINAPTWADGYTGKYWLSSKVKFNGKAKNALQLQKPLRIKGYYGNTSINPFKISEITHSHNYCEECGKESTDFCEIHQTE